MKCKKLRYQIPCITGFHLLFGRQIKRESKLVATRNWNKGEMGSTCFMSHCVSFGDDEKYFGITDDDCTSLHFKINFNVWVLSITEWCARAFPGYILRGHSWQCMRDHLQPCRLPLYHQLWKQLSRLYVTTVIAIYPLWKIGLLLLLNTLVYYHDLKGLLHENG